jgi:hypothetical protein
LAYDDTEEEEEEVLPVPNLNVSLMHHRPNDEEWYLRYSKRRDIDHGESLYAGYGPKVVEIDQEGK